MDLESQDDALRPFDPALTRRHLRRALLSWAQQHGKPSSVPHSFEQAALLSFSERALRRRENARNWELLAAAGRAFLVGGFEEEGHAFLRRGFERADALGSAYFGYLIGQFVHYRRRELREARKAFQSVIETSPMRSDVHAVALLALAETLIGLRAFEEARSTRSQLHALDRPRLEARVHLLEAELAWRTGELASAVKLCRKAREAFRRERSDLGVHKADLVLGQAHLGNGDPEKALEIFVRTEKPLRRIADLTHLGPVLDAKGNALRRLGRFSEAEGAFVDALRFAASAERPELMRRTYLNLALSLGASGKTEVGLALLSEVGSSNQSPTERYRCFFAALELVASSRTRLETAPYFLARVYELVPDVASQIGESGLVELVELTRRLGHAGASLPREARASAPMVFGAAATKEAKHFLAVHRLMPPNLEAQVVVLLRRGFQSPHAPAVPELAKFLVSLGGAWFRNQDYFHEFFVPQRLSKFQLAHLRRKGILEIDGVKKGARYRLLCPVS